MNKPINWRLAIFRFLATFFWITTGSVNGFLLSFLFIIIASIFMTMFQTEVAEEAVEDYKAKQRAGTV